MSTGKNTKFDIDLEYGQIREKRVADLLKGSKVEIKTSSKKSVKSLKSKLRHI